MALTPTELTDEQFIATFGDLESETDEHAETKTYKYDFKTGRFQGFIDEEQALSQFIVKALYTQRDYFGIYTLDYGSELEELIGEDVTKAYLESEVPRMVREALEVDDRIVNVEDVEVEIKGDSVYITLTVKSVYGELSTEVEFNV